MEKKFNKRKRKGEGEVGEDNTILFNQYSNIRLIYLMNINTIKYNILVIQILWRRNSTTIDWMEWNDTECQRYYLEEKLNTRATLALPTTIKQEGQIIIGVGPINLVYYLILYK